MAAVIPAMALFLALVLAGAAIHKLIDGDRLAGATGRLLGLNPPLARTAMLAAAALEGAAALALFPPASRPLGAAIAALVWLAYGIALSAARRRGESAMDCGCSFAAHRGGIDGFTLLRPFALTLLALAVMLAPAGGPGFAVEPLFAALALYALFFAAGELAALPPIRRSNAR